MAADSHVIVATESVDRWRARLPELEAWLDDDERRRAGTFHDTYARDRFVLAHALLRAVLGRCLGLDPATVVVRQDALGHPRPADPHQTLRWSLAHGGAVVAACVGAGTAVGLDVEPVDPRRADLPTVARYLEPADTAAFRILPPAARPRALALAWTRLEAEAKGRGVAIEVLRGRRRTGWIRELDVGGAHVASLWTAMPAAIVSWSLADPARG